MKIKEFIRKNPIWLHYQKPNNSRHSLVKKFLLVMDPPQKPQNGMRACHTQRKYIGLELYGVNIANKGKAW
jgi:hypothetical protein